MIAILINTLLTIIMYAVLIRCVLSFLPVNRDNGFVALFFKYTEPIMALARRLTDRLLGGRYMPVDLSPILVLVGIFLLRVIVRIIF